MAERAYQLIQKERMKGVNKAELKATIAEALTKTNFNLIKIVKSYKNT